jgi:hypothetical protein
MSKVIKFCLLNILLFNQLSFALSVETHEKLNEGILSLGGNFHFDNYLTDNLCIPDGRLGLVHGKEVYLWFRDGGRYEDKPPATVPYVRSMNHFHDPLEELPDAGYGWFGKSAILWAQMAPGMQLPGGYYSWRDARGYYYQALTATNQSVRDEYFAKTFRAVGQVMHLVQDMSLPEHARNDGHLLPAYEEWLARTPEGVAHTVAALADPRPFDLAALRQPSPYPEEAPIPIARQFDANLYDGTNPAVTSRKTQPGDSCQKRC